MLKITTHDNGKRIVLELDGKLIGPWVDELERVWYMAERAGSVHVILPIYRSGAALVAVGCLTEALPQDVIKKESAGWRGPAKEVVRADPKVSRVGLGAWVMRRWFSPPGADAKEDAMRSIQEIIFSLMILVGLSMILYDVINARTVARTAERKNLLKKSWLAEDKNSASAQQRIPSMKQWKLGSQVSPLGAAAGARYSEARMH